MKVMIPLQDQVLIQQHDPETEFDGIKLPVVEQEKPNTGTVVRSSKTATYINDENQEVPFQEGDIVVFDQFAHPMPIEENEVSLILISSSKIFGIIV